MSYVVSAAFALYIRVQYDCVAFGAVVIRSLLTRVRVLGFK